MRPQDSFELGDWLVEPQLNRLSRPGGEERQIEPKMMDVLVCLAERSGEVVSRDVLIDTVWPGVFISESVLTRAIAGLRRALGDDAREPRFIETIAKRGYRLIAEAAGGPGLPRPRAAVGAFVVGQWVRAEGFYGRTGQLSEVLDGRRNGYWVVATRRRGKTSFLKQLEHLARTDPEGRLVPVYWDLEGTDEQALAASFEEALADAEPGLESAGVGLAEIAGPDVFQMIGGLRRQLRAGGRTLLLLCDEAEELLNVAAGSELTIRRLRRTLLAQDGLRTVLASGPRLWDLARGSATSPFLDGFLPPIYLGPLEEDAARALVLQGGRLQGGTEGFSSAEVERICRVAGGHPFLLQLVSKRCLEGGDLDRGIAAVSADRSITTLFEVDLELLDDGQRSLLRMLVDAAADQAATDDLSPALQELRQLGLVDLDELSGARVVPPLFRDWLAGEGSGPFPLADGSPG